MAKRGQGPRGLAPGGAGSVRQLQELQARVQQIQEQLAAETVSASVGGGVVEVTMNGQQRVVSLRIAPQVVAEGDLEMLEDLLAGAFNEAVRLSQELAARKLGPLAGGLL